MLPPTPINKSKGNIYNNLQKPRDKKKSCFIQPKTPTRVTEQFPPTVSVRGVSFVRSSVRWKQNNLSLN